MEIGQEEIIQLLNQTREATQKCVRKEEIIKLLDQTREVAQRLIEERNYLRDIANIDPLTGLNNRNALSRIRDFTGIMMVDIDDFKSINDTYGHDKGDEVIQKIAHLIKATTRAKDCVCRFGGDEFIAVFVDCPHEVIRERAKKVGAMVSERVVLENPSRNVTTSIGYAFNNYNETFEQVMKHADIALYESKENGKNRVSEYKTKLPMVIETQTQGISFKH